MSYRPESTAWIVDEPAPILSAFRPDRRRRSGLSRAGSRLARGIPASRRALGEHLPPPRTGSLRITATSTNASSRRMLSDEERQRDPQGTVRRNREDARRHTTACDYQLRDLEIELGLESIRDGDVILDVGCGLGVALRRYASERRVEAHGIDYSGPMIDGAKTRARGDHPGTRDCLPRSVGGRAPVRGRDLRRRHQPSLLDGSPRLGVAAEGTA